MDDAVAVDDAATAAPSAAEAGRFILARTDEKEVGSTPSYPWMRPTVSATSGVSADVAVAAGRSASSLTVFGTGTFGL